MLGWAWWFEGEVGVGIMEAEGGVANRAGVLVAVDKHSLLLQ